MRSTESSGVGVNRFSVGDSGGSGASHRVKEMMRRAMLALPPITLAVALVAMVAATLFVLFDYSRTLDELRQRTAIVARLQSAQPLLARQFAAGSYDPLIGETDPNAALAGVAQRAGLAYGGALLAAALTWRRRRQPIAIAAATPLGELISTIPFGVACWSAAGELIVCNEPYRQRLDVAPQDLQPGTSYLASVRKLVQGGYTKLISETDSNRVIELHREDGSCLLVDERPMSEGGFITLLNDVTELKRADTMLTSIREEQRVLARRYHEEKLKAEAASRSKTAFLAHLSHDIRTPLNHIIGFADLMRHQTYGPLGDERYETYVELIKSSGDRLLSFFASILDLAELENGDKVLKADALMVDELLLATANRYAAQAKRAGLTLVRGAPCGAMLLGDRFSLERMLGNLLDNAIRYTPQGGRITIASYAGDDGVVLEVTDTGVGMAPDRMSALSQPFAFTDASLTKDREGSGLGLAIARAIVELSGGRLAIDSRLGIGTTVAVSLPQHADAQEIATAA